MIFNGKRSAPGIPYPSLASHGVIGDRRTAGLISADGTIDWLCLPDYDGAPVFGALLDCECGGFWKLGPVAAIAGRQEYCSHAPVLKTVWRTSEMVLELTDAMALPLTERAPEDENKRLVLRRLRCVSGQARCTMEVRPSVSFKPLPLKQRSSHIFEFCFEREELILWTSARFAPDGSFLLCEGESAWAALAVQDSGAEWSSGRCELLLAEVIEYWRGWLNEISSSGPRREAMLRSAMLVHLLTYAPTGAIVAAPTTSLPERIGGDWNADYRLSWIRDTSLALEMLATLGKTEDCLTYLDWLASLEPGAESPLQVVYGVHGETAPGEHDLEGVYGYRGSSPVRIGNNAYRQRQLDASGFLADCCLRFLTHGGNLNAQHWRLIQRVASHVAATWRIPDNSLWELPERRHYLSGKVMSWVALDRAAAIGERLGYREQTAGWRAEMETIRAEIVANGWNARLGAFSQSYHAASLDASSLLLSVMDVLPQDDLRLAATREKIVRELTFGNSVYRFDPQLTPVGNALPLGEFEGAFFPCTFWLATCCAKAGLLERAEEILSCAEDAAGTLGIFAEGFDPRNGCFMGNYPLVFSQIEYMRAVREVTQAQTR